MGPLVLVLYPMLLEMMKFFFGKFCQDKKHWVEGMSPSRKVAISSVACFLAVGIFAFHCDEICNAKPMDPMCHLSGIVDKAPAFVLWCVACIRNAASILVGAFVSPMAGFYRGGRYATRFSFALVVGTCAPIWPWLTGQAPQHLLVASVGLGAIILSMDLASQGWCHQAFTTSISVAILQIGGLLATTRVLAHFDSRVETCEHLVAALSVKAVIVIGIWLKMSGDKAMHVLAFVAAAFTWPWLARCIGCEKIGEVAIFAFLSAVTWMCMADPLHLQVGDSNDGPQKVTIAEAVSIRPQKVTIAEGAMRMSKQGVNHIRVKLRATQRSICFQGKRCCCLSMGVDPARREDWLVDSEFIQTFGMTRSAFLALPAWRKKSLKVQHDLF